MKKIFPYILLVAIIVFVPLLPYTLLLLVFTLVTLFSSIPFVALIFLGILLDAFLTPYGIFPIALSAIALIGIFVRDSVQHFFRIYETR